MRPLVPALCFLLVLCACGRPTVRKEMLAPAQADEVARLTRLRVLPFEGDPGGGVRAAVESALASVSVAGRPYFTILGRDAPAEKGMALQWADPKKARPIVYGAEGSVQGAVTANGWHDDVHYESRRECVAEDNKGKCVFWGLRQERCIRRTARFAFSPRVVAKDSGKVLLAQEFAETEKSSGCMDQGGPAEGQTLLAKANKRALARFRDHVAPHVVVLNIPLLTEDESGMDRQTRTLVDGGVDFAKDGDTDKACRVWRSASDGHAAGGRPAGFALPYLLGVCAELEDRLDDAEGLYLKAQSGARAPVAEITDALLRVRATRAGQERLEGQLK